VTGNGSPGDDAGDTRTMRARVAETDDERLCAHDAREWVAAILAEVHRDRQALRAQAGARSWTLA